MRKPLEEIPAYKIAEPLGDYVWEVVSGWHILAQKTIGEQLIRVTDSIAANIAEAYGRYFKKDKIKFFIYARGSVREAIHWVKKAEKRNLLTPEEAQYLLRELKKLPKELNYLIKMTNRNLSK